MIPPTLLSTVAATFVGKTNEETGTMTNRYKFFGCNYFIQQLTTVKLKLDCSGDAALFPKHF